MKIISKTKIVLLMSIFNFIIKVIPHPVINYIKIWFPLITAILGYFRLFNALIGIFFLIAIMDFSNLSFQSLLDTLKIGYNFIKNSVTYLIDLVFKSNISEGRPKVDVKVDPIDKHSWPMGGWYKVDNAGNLTPINDVTTEYLTEVEYLDRLSENKSKQLEGDGNNLLYYLKIGCAVILVAGFSYLIYTNWESLKEYVYKNSSEDTESGSNTTNNTIIGGSAAAAAASEYFTDGRTENTSSVIHDSNVNISDSDTSNKLDKGKGKVRSPLETYEPGKNPWVPTSITEKVTKMVNDGVNKFTEFGSEVINQAMNPMEGSRVTTPRPPQDVIDSSSARLVSNTPAGLEELTPKSSSSKLPEIITEDLRSTESSSQESSSSESSNAKKATIGKEKSEIYQSSANKIDIINSYFGVKYPEALSFDRTTDRNVIWNSYNKYQHEMSGTIKKVNMNFNDDQRNLVNSIEEFMKSRIMLMGNTSTRDHAISILDQHDSDTSRVLGGIDAYKKLYKSDKETVDLLLNMFLTSDRFMQKMRTLIN